MFCSSIVPVLSPRIVQLSAAFRQNYWLKLSDNPVTDLDLGFVKMKPEEFVITTHTVEEVAAFLHKSVSSIYSDVSRNPKGLPPRLPIPGSNSLVFANMHIWAKGLLDGKIAVYEEVIEPKKRKRGRPPNKARSDERHGPES